MEKNLIVIGYGGSGKRYVENLKKYFKDFNIYILKTGKNEIKGENAISTVDEAINLKPYGVFIATPTSTHIDYARKFLNICKFIVIDKPMDSELYKCEVFERNARYSNTKVYLNYQRRFIECWEKLKEEVKKCFDNNMEFRYGIINIDSYMPSWRNERDYRDLYASNKNLGGGALLTECHEIDLIHWIFGEIQEISGKIIKTEKFNLDVEDAFGATLMIKTKTGLKPIFLITDFMNTKTKRYAEFVFDKKSYKIDEDKNELLIYPEDKLIKGTGEKDKLAHEKFIKTLYAKEVENKNVELPNIRDGLFVNAVINSIRNSQKSGQIQELNYSIFPLEGAKYLDYLVERANEEFKDKILAIYGMGSLGYGGYVEGWSDFDIDIIVDNIGYDEREKYFKIGKEIEKEIVKKGFERIDIRTYSLTHLNERKTISPYGECSRASMLRDSAKLIYGKDIRDKVLDRTIKDFNTDSIKLSDNMSKRTKEEWDNTPWDDIAAFFALNARFLYSKDIGKVAGKKVALEYFIDKYSKEYSNNVLMWTIWALACRNSYDKKYIQDRLHSSATDALVEAFNKTKEILLKEEGEI